MAKWSARAGDPRAWDFRWRCGWRSAPIPASEEAAKPDSTERSAPTPPKTSYSGPADVSSRAGQMNWLIAPERLQRSKAMNGQLRELAPGKSLSDNEIENAGDRMSCGIN